MVQAGTRIIETFSSCSRNEAQNKNSNQNKLHQKGDDSETWWLRDITDSAFDNEEGDTDADDDDMIDNSSDSDNPSGFGLTEFDWLLMVEATDWHETSEWAGDEKSEDGSDDGESGADDDVESSQPFETAAAEVVADDLTPVCANEILDASANM